MTSLPRSTTDYVVYINFPSSSKEYAYLCNIPGLSQGDYVIANGTKVRIVRTANYAHQASKYVHPVPSRAAELKQQRKGEIKIRLREIEAEVAQIERFKKLATHSPEAKRLLAELRRLG